MPYAPKWGQQDGWGEGTGKSCELCYSQVILHRSTVTSALVMVNGRCQFRIQLYVTVSRNPTDMRYNILMLMI
jgi:hypothetical protein